MIVSVIDIEERRQALLALPEDWNLDHDGSHAPRPTKQAIDAVCAAAERAICSGLPVESIDADANGGTCLTIRGDGEMYACIYFGNGSGASVVSLEPGTPICESLTDGAWQKLSAKLGLAAVSP